MNTRKKCKPVYLNTELVYRCILTSLFDFLSVFHYSLNVNGMLVKQNDDMTIGKSILVTSYESHFKNGSLREDEHFFTG